MIGKRIPLQAMKALRGCGCKGPHITTTALGRGKVTSPTLRCLYPGKALILILQEADWTPEPVWTWRSEEKSPLFEHRGSNPGHPACNQATTERPVLCTFDSKSRLCAVGRGKLTRGAMDLDMYPDSTVYEYIPRIHGSQSDCDRRLSWC